MGDAIYGDKDGQTVGRGMDTRVCMAWYSSNKTAFIVVMKEPRLGGAALRRGCELG